MKGIVLAILVVMTGTVADVQAQSGRKNKKAVQQKTATSSVINPSGEDTSGTVSLVSASANQALGAAASNRFTIADPVINIFNQRAKGIPVTFSGKDIIGMPGSTYGIANGRILLRNTTAITPGTSYGSGAVGTGTTIMGVGTSENAISVNGKSPYAGPWLWGGKLPNANLAPFLSDSTNKRQ